MRNLLLDMAAILWPTACVACGAADRDLCEACRAEVAKPRAVITRSIGVPCFSAGEYDGALRALLVGLKHEGRVGFARYLGAALAVPLARAAADCEGVPVFVAAPSRAARVRERGYRHVELLLTAALRERDISHRRLRGLRAQAGRTAQVGLTAAERERNASLVAVRRRAARVMAGREVILVDDVVTTGATLRAACDAVENAGGVVRAAVTLCAAGRRDTRLQFGVARDSPDAIEFGETTEHAT